MTAVAEKIAEVLAEHCGAADFHTQNSFHKFACTCGWASDELGTENHRAHVAQMISDALGVTETVEWGYDMTGEPERVNGQMAWAYARAKVAPTHRRNVTTVPPIFGPWTPEKETD